MIYQLTNVLLIQKLLEMARVVPDTDLNALEATLLNSLRRKDARIFVDEHKGEIKGFIFASVEEIDGKDAVYIQFCVIKPDANERNLGMELLSKIRRWAREAGLKDMYFSTRRNVDAFKRKYKFRYHNTMLRRSVDDERTI